MGSRRPLAAHGVRWNAPRVDKRTLITGATGLVGHALLSKLSNPVVLTRDPARARGTLGRVEAHGWEPAADLPPRAAVEGAELVFNLVGEPVAGARWTAKQKQRITDSRVAATRNLVAALSAVSDGGGRAGRVLVSVSAVGYYGDAGDAILDEQSPKGRDFLAALCGRWEEEAMAAERAGIRVVRVRLGLVLSRTGGVLARMLPAFRWGIGGRLGSGRQWMSWIHLDDVVGLLLHAARTEGLSGPINATAPNPVTNADFTHTLAKALHRPAILPVPRLALQAAFGEMSSAFLASQRAVPRAAERSGYTFQHPRLEEALAALLPR